MHGINQLPEGTEGAAALSLIYASVSWICSSLIVWLTWVHHERLSYVAVVGYWSFLGTTASITQQIHDITWWRDIMIAQFARISNFSDNPELAIASGSFGLDLEALCIMFWAGELAQSLFDWDAKPKWQYRLRRINKAGKVTSMLLPLITILLLRVPAIQKTFVLFIILADIPLMLSLTIGSATMIAILIRYVRTKRKFSQWTPPAKTRNTSEAGVMAATASSSDAGSRRTSVRQQGICDRWLMVRFTCAFVVLGIFDITNTLFQWTDAQNNRKDNISREPDLSVARANSSLFLFMPGVTPGIFLFIIFGTTSGHRKKMYETFVPRRWQDPIGSRGWKLSCPTPWSRTWRKVSGESGPSPPPALCVSRSNTLKKAPADTTKPLPSRPIPNLMSVFSPRGGTSGRQPWDEDNIFNAKPSCKLFDLEAGGESKETYYELNPEQSDDSGPVLPIMRANTGHSLG
ncbi:Uu.00g062260.m01.CDS01 [Anthostomella pinea]|uniref:Uu.00g062260.m01.CDS01 n=1 Tax=Anthostomella pinea TaxID=933095 RepID=A0AAI8VMK1_9PEZI|nr:Uu.00g062260.m01.CDS01 [Anthostomella pinea]